MILFPSPYITYDSSEVECNNLLELDTLSYTDNSGISAIQAERTNSRGLISETTYSIVTNFLKQEDIVWIVKGSSSGVHITSEYMHDPYSFTLIIRTSIYIHVSDKILTFWKLKDRKRSTKLLN